MATIPAPPCSSSPTSMLLTPSYCCWSSAPKGVARASAVAAARRTLSSGWDLPRLSAAQPAARKARLEELDTSNMLLRQRIIFLGSPVDDLSADLIISQLLLLDAEDHTKDIKLFINSPGGSITAAAGTKGKRFCMPNARIMIHQPSGGAGGKATEMGLQIREMLYEKIKMNKIMSRITGKPEEQIDEDTKFDYFMSPWEAKDYGILDSIIDEGKLGLVAPMAGAVPPPKSRLWYLWNASGPTRKIMKNLPSEEKFVGNGNGSTSGDNGKQKEAFPTLDMS